MTLEEVAVKDVADRVLSQSPRDLWQCLECWSQNLLQRMDALVIRGVLNKDFINFITGEILQVHKLHVAAVPSRSSRSSRLRIFVSSNASFCSTWHCHKSDCKCTEALHGKAHESGNARLSNPRKNKGNWNWQAVAAIDWAIERRAAEMKDCHKGLHRWFLSWNGRTQPKHAKTMACTRRDDTSPHCNLQLRRNRVPNLERPRACAAAGSPGSVVAVLRMDQWVWDTASLTSLPWTTAFRCVHYFRHGDKTAVICNIT